jgi:PAT family beta-lactamase induction signal transducer AmpG
VVIDASDSFLFPLVYPLLTKQLAFSEQQVATLSTIGGAVAALSSIGGGVLSDRWGRRRTLVFACLGVAGLNAVFACLWPLWGNYAFQVTFAVAGAVVSGVVYASNLALFMDLVHPRVAATQFQLYMALQNTRGFWGNRLGGWTAERLSAPRMFGLGAAIEVLPLVLLPFLDPRQVKNPADSTG